ncbi:Hypothetical protein BHY_1508 (plasmid) [Borrelia nietonii YOR]|uniref:Uncharacterized protein n=2 Tax=Borrelia TaxID=138 RepID=W5SCR7_9SPIR|nr:Hypothetical protein BHY_1508 [Borrelia nietonii YOR]
MGMSFLCLHYYIEKFKKLQFSVNDINKNYHKFVHLGYITSNYYILNPCAVLRSFGINISVRWEDPVYRYTSNEFEINEVKIKCVLSYYFIVANKSSVLYGSLELKEREKEFFERLSVYLSVIKM